MPADDSQPACALSGERFDTFWDDAREEWRYRDAVLLSAEQAARWNLPLLAPLPLYCSLLLEFKVKLCTRPCHVAVSCLQAPILLSLGLGAKRRMQQL